MNPSVSLLTGIGYIKLKSTLRVSFAKFVESALAPDLYPVGEGVLLRILGGGVLPSSPNPDPISDQMISFFSPAFRPGL